MKCPLQTYCLKYKEWNINLSGLFARGEEQGNQKQARGEECAPQNLDSAGGTLASICMSYFNLVRHKNSAQMSRWSSRDKIPIDSPFLIRYSLGLFLVQILSDSKSNC